MPLMVGDFHFEASVDVWEHKMAECLLMVADERMSSSRNSSWLNISLA
jgi:hypothetical protein